MENTQPISPGCYNPCFNGFEKVDTPAELYLLLEHFLVPAITMDDKSSCDVVVEGAVGNRDQLRKINVESYGHCSGLLKLKGTVDSEKLEADAVKTIGGRGYSIKGTLGKNEIDVKVEKNKEGYVFTGKIGDMEFERNRKKLTIDVPLQGTERTWKVGAYEDTIDILSTPQKDDIVSVKANPEDRSSILLGDAITGKAGKFELNLNNRGEVSGKIGPDNSQVSLKKHRRSRTIY